MKHILMLVHSDYVHDNRVRREAEALVEAGYEVTCGCVGKNLPDSVNGVRLISFEVKAQSGKKRFIEVIIGLGKILRKTPCDSIHAHDLDAFTAASFYNKNRAIPIIYDSHELYLDSISLYNRPFTRFLWSIPERIYINRAAKVITVCGSIGSILQKIYNLKEPPVIIRNLSDKPSPGVFSTELSENVKQLKSRYGHILLYHGMVREGRGLRLMLKILKEKSDWAGLVCGDGPFLDEIKKLAHESKLDDRILFAGNVNRADYLEITQFCDAGLCYLKPVAPNNYYAFPNKLGEYIQVGLPVLGADLPEIGAIIKEYEVGKIIINSKDAAAFLKTLEDETVSNRFKKNLQRAAGELNWQNEKRKLIELYADILMQN